MIFDLFKPKPRVENTPAQTLSEEFRYKAIPRRSVLGAAIDVYPRERSCIKTLSIAAIRDRYAEQLHAALDNLPLADEEIDAFVIPVVLQAIRQMHLLPASEMHHHWGWGGLLVHSLEVAKFAVDLAEQELFGGDTQEQRYMNRPRWASACCILGLIHDVGKCHDMTVSSTDGQVWNCLHEPLMAWLERLNISEYQVSWRKDRIHKAHEARSLRMAYMRLVPLETLRFLSEVTGPNILDAIDAAVVGREGKLTHILKEAEARSIAADAEQRRSDSIAQEDPSKFFSRAIVQAIQEMLVTERWHLNDPQGSVFYDGQQLFVEANNRTGQSLRECALVQGNKFVPQNIDVQIEMLESAGVLTPYENGDLHWVLESVNGTELSEPKSCVCLSHEAGLSLANASPANLRWKSSKSESPKRHSFTAPRSLFDATDPSDKKRSSKAEDEVQPQLPEPPAAGAECKPLTPHECQDLVKRVFLQAEQELLSGGGHFISKVIHGPNGELVCSSTAAEQYLKKFSVDTATSKAIFKANSSIFRVVFDSDGHRLVFPNRNDSKGEHSDVAETQL
jgi:hypothetical protein